jgi:hypothetical protein
LLSLPCKQVHTFQLSFSQSKIMCVLSCLGEALTSPMYTMQALYHWATSPTLNLVILPSELKCRFSLTLIKDRYFLSMIVIRSSRILKKHWNKRCKILVLL